MATTTTANARRSLGSRMGFHEGRRREERAMTNPHERYKTDIRDRVAALAADCNDTTAAALARHAKDVREIVRKGDVLPRWHSHYRFVVELDDVEVQLDWNAEDGWDGPSTVADVMAKLWLQERRRTAKALAKIKRILQSPTIEDV